MLLQLSQPRCRTRTVWGTGSLGMQSMLSRLMRVVSLALNLPGPAACSRLRALGHAVTKVEPPSGDPMQHYCKPWYDALHEGVAVQRLDLKAAGDRERFDAVLADADVLIT